MDCPDPRKRLATAVALVSFAVLAHARQSTAGAPCPEEPPLQNFTGGGTVVCPCFVPGEEAGAVLQAPAAHYPLEILRIGVGWGSQLGGAPDVLEGAIKVYADGLPNPGAPIFDLPGPVLFDGFINEFDIEPLPGQVIINSGEFTVTLEFLSNNAGDIFAPSAVNDGNGCQPGKNVVFAIPGGWNDACQLGISGDWVFYAIYRPVNCGGPATNYCISTVNSTGQGATINLLGSTSLLANDLILTSSQCPPGQLGLFYYGPNEVQVPFGDGVRCVGGSTFRFNPPVGIDPIGNAFRPIDYSMPPANVGNGMISPGDTWKFQFWYRDPAAGMSGFNLSNGLSLDFVP